MKRIRSILPILMSLVLVASAARCADLAWEYDTSREALIDGYRILYADVNLGTGYTYTVPDPTARKVADIVTTLKLIPSHEYRFTCRAYAGEGESPDSNEISFTVPPWTPPDDRQPVSIEIPAPGTILIYKP